MWITDNHNLKIPVNLDNITSLGIYDSSDGSNHHINFYSENTVTWKYGKDKLERDKIFSNILSLSLTINLSDKFNTEE